MKQPLRSKLFAARKTHPPRQRSSKSARIARRVRALPDWPRAKTIMLYSSTPTEVQTRQLIERALAQGKRVCLPGHVGKGKRMQAFEVHSLDELVRGEFGMLEPMKVPGRLVAAEAIEFVLVPGVAFDRNGRRLGRGGGHYDRFLSRVKGRKIGVCFEFQLMKEVPVEPHDMRMDAVVTERRVIGIV